MSYILESLYVEKTTQVLEEFVEAVSPHLRTVTDSYNVWSQTDTKGQA